MNTLKGNCFSCICCSQTSLGNLVHSRVSFGTRIPGWWLGLASLPLLTRFSGCSPAWFQFSLQNAEGIRPFSSEGKESSAVCI